MGPWRLAGLLTLSLVALAGCGGGSGGGGDSTTAASCGMGFGPGPAPSCGCQSWAYALQVWKGCCCSDCVSVEPDLSRSPARLTLRVGQRFMVAVTVADEQPDRCNTGWSTVPTAWTASIPAVLQFQSAAPASVTTAVFAATAPGTATIIAEGLRVATRETPPVGLSACVEERTSLLTYECLRRVPVEVVVLP